MDDYGQLSELQHFAFCRRQWALIHIEQQWADNLRTIEGELRHRRVHDESQVELRGDTLITRGMRIVSHRLKVCGICDVVEFHKDPDGITLFGRAGTWKPYPIEYKRGAPKEHEADVLQLCGQAMCLEEMLLCTIPEGSLFYGKTKRRQQVFFTKELRGKVETMLAEMYQYRLRGYTPKVKPSKSCNACSLKEQCLPSLMGRRSVSDYFKQSMEDGA